MIYRACYAKSMELHSPTGEPTKGTYYFLQSFMKLLREFSPSALVMTADGPRAELERSAWLPTYKANRGAPDDGLLVQVKRVHQLVELMGVPVLRVKGWEADDVIASLVEKFAHDFDETVLISGDKDIHQLVRSFPCVSMYDPMRDKMWDVAAVEERWGVNPKKVIQVQALLGDSTDNIPGVKGFGEKGAVAAIKVHGSVKRLYAARAILPKAKRRALEEADLKTCLKLVRLNRKLDISIDAEDLKFDGLDMEAAKPVFKELGFKRWSS